MRIAILSTLVLGAACDTTSSTVPADLSMPHPNADFGPEDLAGKQPPAATLAVVTTSSFTTSGAVNTIALADKSVTAAIDASIDQDNVVRVSERKVYVIDRSHGSVRVYDPVAQW